MKHLSYLLTKLIRGASTIGEISIWLIALGVCYDVLLRMINSPSTWASEISGYLMIAAAVMASGLAITKGEHFEIEIITDLLRPKTTRLLLVFNNINCLALMAFILCGCYQLINYSIQFDIRTATMLRIPMYIPQGIFVIGITMMALAFFLKIILLSTKRST